MHLLAASSGSGAGAGVGALAFIPIVLLLIFLYWVPTVIAVVRHVPNLGSVVVIDGFLGWTLIGWVVALAMAVRSVPPQPQGAPTQPPLQ